MKMLFAAMLVDTLHSALEDRIVAFHRIGVDFAAHVLVALVGDAAVLGKLFANSPVMQRAIGHQAAFAFDVVAHDGNDAGDRMPVGMKRTGRAATFNQRHHHVLVVVAANIGPKPRLLTDVGFVGFDDFAVAAHRLHAENAHCFAHAVWRDRMLADLRCYAKPPTRCGCRRGATPGCCASRARWPIWTAQKKSAAYTLPKRCRTGRWPTKSDAPRNSQPPPLATLIAPRMPIAD